MSNTVLSYIHTQKEPSSEYLQSVLFSGVDGYSSATYTFLRCKITTFSSSLQVFLQIFFKNPSNMIYVKSLNECSLPPDRCRTLPPVNIVPIFFLFKRHGITRVFSCYKEKKGA